MLPHPQTISLQRRHMPLMRTLRLTALSRAHPTRRQLHSSRLLSMRVHLKTISALGLRRHLISTLRQLEPSSLSSTLECHLRSLHRRKAALRRTFSNLGQSNSSLHRMSSNNPLLMRRCRLRSGRHLWAPAPRNSSLDRRRAPIATCHRRPQLLEASIPIAQLTSHRGPIPRCPRDFHSQVSEQRVATCSRACQNRRSMIRPPIRRHHSKGRHRLRLATLGTHHQQMSLLHRQPPQASRMAFMSRRRCRSNLRHPYSILHRNESLYETRRSCQQGRTAQAWAVSLIANPLQTGACHISKDRHSIP
mmetsp:Transcript_5998/g.18066  ORF Transcript_5998/g.18066 Transcript_5998/m.18066 type:complete len:305 (-) Transcript_5998:3520-4434(-)